LLSFGCNELYVYGNAIKISTESSILSLCEVEVYADVYGKRQRNELWRLTLSSIQQDIKLFKKTDR